MSKDRLRVSLCVIGKATNLWSFKNVNVAKLPIIWWFRSINKFVSYWDSEQLILYNTCIITDNLSDYVLFDWEDSFL